MQIQAFAMHNAKFHSTITGLSGLWRYLSIVVSVTFAQYCSYILAKHGYEVESINSTSPFQFFFDSLNYLFVSVFWANVSHVVRTL